MRGGGGSPAPRPGCCLRHTVRTRRGTKAPASRLASSPAAWGREGGRGAGLCMGTGPGETAAAATCREPPRWHGPSSAPHTRRAENKPPKGTAWTPQRGAWGQPAPNTRTWGAGGVGYTLSPPLCSRDVTLPPGHVRGSADVAPKPSPPPRLCQPLAPSLSAMSHPSRVHAPQCIPPGDKGSLVRPRRPPRQAAHRGCPAAGCVPSQPPPASTKGGFCSPGEGLGGPRGPALATASWLPARRSHCWSQQALAGPPPRRSR